MSKSYQIVKIDEAACIGCTKCLPVCPVDAIVGASKQIHVVLTEYCIGCGLCLPPCPVNCIEILPVAHKPAAQISKLRSKHRKQRLEKAAKQKLEADKQAIEKDMQSAIAASLARVMQKRQTLNLQFESHE